MKHQSKSITSVNKQLTQILTKKINKNERDIAHHIKKEADLERERHEAIADKDAAKNAVSALTREVEWLRKQTDVEKADIMGLVQYKDKMKRQLQTVEATNNKNRNEIVQKNQAIDHLND